MHNTNHTRPFILMALIMLLAILSTVWFYFILKDPRKPVTPVAEIYQNGALVKRIDLSQVKDTYTLQITSADGSYNTIEVHQGSIGITAADCPDQYCIHQGFIQDTVMPITCLPHRLVIQIRDNSSYDNP